MSLLSTSLGVRRGSTILEIAKNRFPFRGTDLKGIRWTVVEDYRFD